MSIPKRLSLIHTNPFKLHFTIKEKRGGKSDKFGEDLLSLRLHRYNPINPSRLFHTEINITIGTLFYTSHSSNIWE